MRRFSIGTALGDAFSLIGRRPLSVLAWGALIIAPIFATFAMMVPAMEAMVALDVESSSGAMPSDFFAHMMQFQLGSMLINLVQMLLMTVIYAAVFRSVLRPAETSWFSLRLGMDELRLAVVGLAIGVGLYVILMFLVFLAVGVGLAAWGAGTEPGPVAVSLIVAFVLVLVVAMCWGLARVSMIAPATILYRDFAFAQGWRLAKGQAWPLVGLMIVVALVIILLEVILLLVGIAVAAATVGGSEFLASAAAESPFTTLRAWVEANWHWVAIGAVVASAIYGGVLTLTIAPFASACRQLAASAQPAEASPAPGA